MPTAETGCRCSYEGIVSLQAYIALTVLTATGRARPCTSRARPCSKDNLFLSTGRRTSSSVTWMRTDNGTRDITTESKVPSPPTGGADPCQMCWSVYRPRS